MATVQDRTHAVNGLNDPQQGACSGPEAPAHAPCSAGRDADLCHSQICQASNSKENTMRAVTVTELGRLNPDDRFAVLIGGMQESAESGGLVLQLSDGEP